jgi:hypothetical protein
VGKKMMSPLGYAAMYKLWTGLRENSTFYCQYPLRNYRIYLFWFLIVRTVAWNDNQIKDLWLVVRRKEWNKHQLDDRVIKLPASNSLMTTPGQCSLSIATLDLESVIGSFIPCTANRSTNSLYTAFQLLDYQAMQSRKRKRKHKIVIFPLYWDFTCMIRTLPSKPSKR